MQRVLISGDTRYPLNRKVVRQAVEDTLTRNKISSDEIEVSVTVIGKRKMRALSSQYMKDGLDHEVLSFPLEEITQDSGKGFVNAPDDILRLGDVVLSWPQVVALAGTEDIMVDDEVYKLVAHSVEHLLGKHHE